jgi:hypothetical protein
VPRGCTHSSQRLSARIEQTSHRSVGVNASSYAFGNDNYCAIRISFVLDQCRPSHLVVGILLGEEKLVCENENTWSRHRLCGAQACSWRSSPWSPDSAVSLIASGSVSLLLRGFRSISHQPHAYGKSALDKYRPCSNYFRNEQNPQDDREDQRGEPYGDFAGRPPSTLRITGGFGGGLGHRWRAEAATSRFDARAPSVIGLAFPCGKV